MMLVKRKHFFSFVKTKISGVTSVVRINSDEILGFGSLFEVAILHAWKLNMEPENRPKRPKRTFHLPTIHFQGPC